MFLSGIVALDLLLPLALILLISKTLQLVCKKFSLPQVVGMLIAGIVVMLLGKIPVVGDVILNDSGRTGIKFIAEIGVVLIMFSAGLGTDVKSIKQSGVASVVVTLMGVIVPMALGFLVAGLFNGWSGTVSYTVNGVVYEHKKILSNLFYGVILTATSVSVTVATLKELGRLNGKAGTIIISAAILDDIIGVIVLSIILSISGSGASGAKTFGSLICKNDIAAVIINVIAFFIFTIAIGLLFHYIFKVLNKKMSHKRRVPIFGLVVCFFMAWASENFFGVADITGAFFAGLFLAGIGHHINPKTDNLDDDTTEYIERKNDVLSYMMFSPVFFANVGINITFSKDSLSLIGFGVSFILAGLLGKVLGCGFGAKVTKNSWKDSLRVGVGMMARAEVALICATKGIDAGIIDGGISTYIVIMIIISSFATPLILKATYKNEKPVKVDYEEEKFSAIHDKPIITTDNTHSYNDNDVEP